MAKNITPDIVIVGDVHGHYEQFIYLLSSARLIGPKNNWIGGRSILVQMGDVIDRGPESMKVDAFIDDLQKQAEAAGGAVIRLVGNHEAELIMGNYLVSEMPKKQAVTYQKKLIKKVLEEKMHAAYSARGLLFTHAGVTGKLLNIFQMQLGELTEESTAALINSIFINSVKHCFFKHPIFNISISRGGKDKYGGIFWEDLQDLYLSMPRSPLRQVVGHTMVDEIVINVPKNIIATDVGLERCIQYLRIRGNKMEITTVAQVNLS